MGQHLGSLLYIVQFEETQVPENAAATMALDMQRNGTVRGAEITLGCSGRYPFSMDEDRVGWLERRTTGAIIVAALLLLPALLTLLIPVSDVSAHNVLHHLNFLPLMIAGMLFGWRGALVASIAAGVLNAPIIARHWTAWPTDAQDQVVELIIFSLAGLIAGYLSDRERAHRQHLEK